MSIKSSIEYLRTLATKYSYAGNNWPYRGGRSQRDNKVIPHGSCNFTACANCLDYLGVEILPKIRIEYADYEQTEDILTAFSESKTSIDQFKITHHEIDLKKNEFRPRHFSDHVAWVVNYCVGKNIAVFGYRTLDQIIEAILNYKPVVVSGKFTSFGHFIALKGLTPDKQYFWVDDSWGNYNTKYTNRNGHNVLYSVELIKEVCWQEQKKHRTIVFEPD